MTLAAMNDQTVQPTPPPHPRATAFVALKWALLAIIVAVSIWAGHVARVCQFNITQPIHFSADVTRNWMWGSYTFANIHDKGRSFLDTYDDLGIQNRGAQIYCDYAPLRMAVFTLWAASDEKAYPDRTFRNTYDFHTFYLSFNATMELIGAAGAFMLVRAVVRRSRAMDGDTEPWWTFTGVGVALAAALIIWFNPAMWLSAHSWPGGDSWIIPPFIWAVYFCVRRNWFIAGLVLGFGALFKGQQFIIAPVFILWPLFQGRPLAALRLICGVLALFGLATAGWTLTYIDLSGVRHVSSLALSYLMCVVAVTIGIPPATAAARRRFTQRRHQPLLWTAAITICIFALSWPLLIKPPTGEVRNPVATADWNETIIITMTIIGTAAACLIRHRAIGVAAAGLAGASALASMPLFGTCYAWLDASYLFGPTHWEVMVMGLTSNLPGIMQRRFGWQGQDVINQVQTTITVFGNTIDLTLRRIFMWSFAVLLVISAAGVAMQDRRRSTRLLIAVCTPWLLFFCIPAQIHERYLLFGAATAAICIGDSLGMALLGIFFSAVTWIMTMSVLNGNPFARNIWDKYLAKNYSGLFPPGTTFAHSLQHFVIGTFPDIGWAVLLATGIFLYMSVTPLWVRRRKVNLITPVLPAVDLPIVIPARDRPLPPLEAIPLE